MGHFDQPMVIVSFFWSLVLEPNGMTLGIHWALEKIINVRSVPVDRWIFGSDLKTQLVAASGRLGTPNFHFWKGLEGFLHYDQPLKNKCTTKVNLSKFTIDINTSSLISYGYFNDNNHCCRSRESLQRIVGGDCIFQNPAQPKVGSPKSPPITPTEVMLRIQQANYHNAPG